MLTQQTAEIEEVRWAVRECLEALRTWDSATLARIFDRDPAAVHYGTAEDEAYIGGETYLRAMERQHTVTIPDMEFAFLPGSPIIQARENVAWVVGQARISGTLNHHYFMVNTRVSFILEKHGDPWQIVHSHFSIGVSPS